MFILIPVFLLLIGGLCLIIGPGFKTKKANALFSMIIIIVAAIVTMLLTWRGEVNVTLLSFMQKYQITLRQDNLGRLFLTISSLVWVLVSIYAYEYMQHEEEVKRFFGFFMLVYAVLICLDSAGNLISFYFFYEMMTLTSLPLVLHERTREAVMAGLKYLFYSMAGAYFALFGIYLLNKNADTLDFVAGGSLRAENVSSVVLLGIFFMIIGFGAKAGMLPLHAWLPTAHPVAPAPASAALSAIIVKGGVLALIRSIFYVVGVKVVYGTWVWYAWMLLSLITVFMGSMLAFREKVFKKRLAYSTVSQASYIVFGLSVLNPMAMTGALLHFIFHAIIKCALFMCAGIFIIRTGKKRVDEYKLIGKSNPATLWAYTFVSLGLIGIPPTSGFVSKWYLAGGALRADIGMLKYFGPAVLLVSALLTAGYLLPIMWDGFFGADYVEKFKIVRYKEWKSPMVWCVAVLALLTLLMGLFPDGLTAFISTIVNEVYGGF